MKNKPLLYGEFGFMDSTASVSAIQNTVYFIAHKKLRTALDFLN